MSNSFDSYQFQREWPTSYLSHLYLSSFTNFGEMLLVPFGPNTFQMETPLINLSIPYECDLFQMHGRRLVSSVPVGQIRFEASLSLVCPI